MRLSRPFVALLLLLGLFCTSSLSAQHLDEAYVKDSISLETDYRQTNAKRKRGKALPEDWITIFQKADSLKNVYPDQTYFPYKKAVLLYRLAVNNIYRSDLPKALEQLTEAIKIKKRIGKYHEASRDYYMMGIVWSRLKESSKSKVAYDSSYAITQRNLYRGASELRHKAILLNIFGCHYANVDSLDQAETYFKKAIRFADSIDYKSQVAVNSIQYAEVIFDQGRYQEALDLRKNAQAIYEEIRDTLGLFENKFNLAESYYELGRYGEALQLLQESIAWREKLNQQGEMLLEYTLYANTLAKNNRFKEAFQAQKRLQGLVDSLRNESEYKKIADIEANFKYESTKQLDSLRIVRERQVVEARNEQKAKTRFWLVTSILLIVIGLIAFIYFRNRQRIKEQAYQNILLNNKIATKTEEINELLTETVQHIKSKERIAENLSKLAKSEEGITLKSILADLNADKVDDTKLLLLKENISEANYDFIKTLREQYPDLSKTDVDICTFLKIGLDRNQIAKLRNTSVEAVRKSRHRIRKKLQLEDEVELEVFLSSLS